MTAAPVAVEGGSAGDDDAPAPRWRPVAALAAAVCLPLLVGVVAVAGDDWHPTGDMAQAELHVRGFMADPPLVGAAGRLGPLDHQGSHPGPSMWFLLLPTYRLFGQTGWALEVGVAVVAAVTVVGTLLLARRRGGDALLVVVAVALAALVRANGPEVFVDPWNPWLPVLPFLAFMLLVWSVLEDDRWALPWVLAVGTHCVQSHVGYAPLVGALGVLAAAWAVRRRWWSALALSGAVTFVLWLPPLVEQLGARGDHPGNLRILWQHFTRSSEPTVGFGGALRAVAGELAVSGPWLVGRGHQPTDPPSWLGFVVLLAVWAGAAGVGWRCRLLAPLRLHAVLALAWVVALASMARVFGEFFDYVIRWATTLAALVAAAIVWTLWEAFAARRPTGRRPATGAAIGLLALAVVAGSIAAVRVESSGLRNSRIVAALTPAVADAVAAIDPDGRFLVRWEDSVSLNATGVGVLLELERRGYRVGADPLQRAAVLPHRALLAGEATAVVWVVVGPAVERLRADRTVEEVAAVDPRNREERGRSAALAASIDAALGRAGLDELTPVLDQSLVGVALDRRVPVEVKAQVEELLDLGLPAVAFVEVTR
ncbi:MAG: hypothetical protein H0W25_12910 [Acidimicrobiia bacterium]|nr:hypothetical protein [Acidimicrobiia bacterium]